MSGESKDYASVAYESGAKKVGEDVANRAINFVVDKVKSDYGKKKIEIGSAFERYLENATKRYNQVRTSATGSDPRSIIDNVELVITDESEGDDAGREKEEGAPRESVKGVGKPGAKSRGGDAGRDKEPGSDRGSLKLKKKEKSKEEPHRDSERKSGDTLYVKLNVRHQNETTDTATVKNLTAIRGNLLISGSGGTGKSMLMRYLFLKTAFDGDYIPVFVELRKVRSQSAGSVSIERLIEDCMAQFDVVLPEDEFIYSLRLGKYLFLFDGFDEIGETLALETADKIQQFCAKYHKNACIMTSRPTDSWTPLETFTHLKLMPLNKEQAAELAAKLCDRSETAAAFCRQLDETLFETHRDFAENPLLLSVMYLTFLRRGSLSGHLAEFYQKAYEALYNQHDNCKGVFRRDFRCGSLDDGRFRLLFARICFQSYYNRKQVFMEWELLDYIKKSAAFLGFDGISETDYLYDLKNAACLIVGDGTAYTFSHRSFRPFFAAVYTFEALSGDRQKELFQTLLHNSADCRYQEYFDLMDQIDHDTFTENALEDGLRELLKNAAESGDAALYLLKQRYGKAYYAADKESGGIRLTTHAPQSYFCRLLTAFAYCHPDETVRPTYPADAALFRLIDKASDPERGVFTDPSGNRCRGVSFEDLDRCGRVSDADRQAFYQTLIRCYQIPLLRQRIEERLEELTFKRAKLAEPNLIDSL